MIHGRGVGHGLDEGLVLRREGELSVSVHSLQYFVRTTRLKDRLGRTPGKDDAARVGTQPFLRLWIQLVRVRIEGEAALDASVKKWLKQAYDAA